MSTKYTYPQVEISASIDNENPSADLMDAPGDTQYNHIEKLVVNIHQAAKGGGGKLRLQDSRGTILGPIIDVNGIKDFTLDFGEDPGLNAGDNLAIQAIVYGAQTEQAKLYLTGNGHTSFGR